MNITVIFSTKLNGSWTGPVKLLVVGIYDICGRITLKIVG